MPLFHRVSSDTVPPPPAPVSASASTGPQPDASACRTGVVFLFSEGDRALWEAFAPHLACMQMRLHELDLHWHVYSYPVHPLPSPQRDEHEAFLAHLHDARLFVPCTSADLLWRLLTKRRQDPRLGEALAATHVQPLPFKAVHGVTQSLLARPLAAYEGHAREDALAHLIAALETRISTLVRGEHASAAPAVSAEPLLLLLRETQVPASRTLAAVPTRRSR